ncbi:MAG TPA: DUF4097 family beta strand repeat-containing protein [Longimicrobiaceae bacterium]|nr:DUF4097 family beta strand repeat-containing protein [Longimicrobiaceae bacterium]
MKAKILIPAALAVLAAGSAPAQERIDARRSTGATGVVEIHNVAGTVRVLAWNRNEVHVTGTLGRGSDRLELVGEGDRVVVRVVLPRRGHDNRGSDIEVRVPGRKTVNVRTVSADINVAGVTGSVDVRAVSGDVGVSGRPRDVFAQSRSGDASFTGESGRVHAESVSGDVTVGGTVREQVEASAVSGDVSVTAASGEVRATSVSGQVEVTSMRGRAEVTTVSGDVRLAGRALHGSFQTVSGGIYVSGDLARDGTTSFNSHSGEIELRLSSGTSAAVDVSTFSGGILNDMAGARVTRSSRREQHFTVGRGDARVSIRTFSGGVKLTNR